MDSVLNKFGRNYELQIYFLSADPITIRLPFTVEFDITRNTLTSANVCQLRIYNLAPLKRNQIRVNASDYGQYIPLIFRAGYGDNLATVFTGNISQAWSVREGTNFITQIECYDGGFAFNNGKTSTQFPAGVSQENKIKALIRDLPFVSEGVIGSIPPSPGSRGNSYSGNTAEILGDLSGGGFFIDSGKANILGTNEFISDSAGTLIVNPQSGLLGTPVLERTILHFDMLFEPNLNVGRKIKLESATASNFNGEYKVTAVKHRGVISGAQAGSVITTGEFFYSKILTGVR